MESHVSKRRAISILAVLGAVLYMIATWNAHNHEPI